MAFSWKCEFLKIEFKLFSRINQTSSLASFFVVAELNVERALTSITYMLQVRLLYKQWPFGSCVVDKRFQENRLGETIVVIE